MRILTIVIVVVALLGAGYFYFNVSSYEPSTGTRIPVLPEQNIDDLKVDTAEVAPTSAPAIQDMATAKEMAHKAFETYTDYQRDLPKQATQTINLLLRLMAKGKLPIYFVDVKPEGYEQQTPYFEPLKFDPFNIAHLRLTQGRAMCNDVEGSSGGKVVDRYVVAQGEDGKNTYKCVDANCPANEYYDVMIGDILANKFLCEPKLKPLSGDRIFLGGPGDDAIKQTAGNAIVDGGTGNDNITLQNGRKIMVISQGWGQDSITLDCKGAVVNKEALPPFPLPWNYDFTNFVVFGNGIRPEDLKFNGLEIEHIVTGDKVTFSEYCFNIVFAEDFQAQGIPDKID